MTKHEIIRRTLGSTLTPPLLTGSPFFYDTCRYHDNQFGFRPNLSTESAVLYLKHAVTYYTRRDTLIYACFLNLSRMFDLVSYDILWKKLEQFKLPTEIIHITMSRANSAEEQEPSKKTILPVLVIGGLRRTPQRLGSVFS